MKNETLTTRMIKKVAAERSRIMRYALVFAVLTMFLVAAFSSNAHSGDLNLGISVEDGKVKGFYLGVKDYYKVPEKEVHVIRERRLPDDEMPVAFFIARRARVAPSEVIEMRSQGLSWMDITYRYRLDPDIYYVPVRSEKLGPPYGRAYGHYKHGRGRRKFEGRFSDADVVNMVNLRFLAERYKTPPENIIRMRANGRSFVDIDRDLSQGGPQLAAAEQEDQGHHDRGRGHGRKHKRKHKHDEED
jgi:hypothetical protein